MRAARVDANQAAIVAALRKIGATVELLHSVGDGVPDLLVGHRCENYLIEVKTPKGRKNKRQEAWHRDWRGNSFVVRSVDEALRIVAGFDDEMAGNA
jgi:hypothetical protein